VVKHTNAKKLVRSQKEQRYVFVAICSDQKIDKIYQTISNLSHLQANQKAFDTGNLPKKLVSTPTSTIEVITMKWPMSQKNGKQEAKASTSLGQLDPGRRNLS